MQHPSRRKMVAVAILALLITAGGSAHAAPTSDPVEQTAELIEAIAPRSSPLEVGSEADGGAIHFITETAVTTIPLSPELPVTIEDADGLVAPFGIDLPAEVNVTSAQTATDGTVVFPAVGRGGRRGCADHDCGRRSASDRYRRSRGAAHLHLRFQRRHRTKAQG